MKGFKDKNMEKVAAIVRGALRTKSNPTGLFIVPQIVKKDVEDLDMKPLLQRMRLLKELRENEVAYERSLSRRAGKIQDRNWKRDLGVRISWPFMELDQIIQTMTTTMKVLTERDHLKAQVTRMKTRLGWLHF